MDIHSKFIGLFEIETDIINKVKALKADGWTGGNIYLLLWEHEQFTLLRYREMSTQLVEDGLWTADFQEFIVGDSYVRKAMDVFGIQEAELEKYYETVEKGGYVLCADQGQLVNYYIENSEFKLQAFVQEKIDATPHAPYNDKRYYPRRGDRRIGLDGQNIRRAGDRIADPDAEVGFEPAYYKLGRDSQHKPL